MKKAKKIVAMATALIITLMMSPISYHKVFAAEQLSDQMATESITKNNKIGLRLQDDFYGAINNEWLSTTKIEQGKDQASVFQEVSDMVMKQKRDIINELLEKQNQYGENTDQKKIINIYNNTLDTEDRDKEGIKPVQKNLDKIKNIKTIQDITNLWSNKEILNSTINFTVGSDAKDATMNVLYIEPTTISLGNSDEYNNPTESTAKTKALIQEYYNKILMLDGYTQEEAQSKVNDMFKFEGMIAKSMTGHKEELADSNIQQSIYNVYTLDELNALAPNLDLTSVMASLGIEKANKIILEEPKWLEAFNNLYTNENVPLIKNYLEILNLSNASEFLSEDFEKVGTEFNNKAAGIVGSRPKEEEAVSMVNGLMGMGLGRIYADKYVSQKTKDDVENITNEVIETYKSRINNLNWMSSETKKNAIEKLEKLDVKIGYPENWIDYSNVDIKSYKDGGSLYENAMTIYNFSRNEMFSRLNKQVDKKNDFFQPQTVNAFYNATNNSIMIPGGIIQGHFYDPNASREVNLGGIGAVIGHEISHAFDNNGAKYDADGNFKNWWTADDYKEFEDKTQKVKDFYSKIEALPGKNINGALTVGENIADMGGMACMLDILGTMKNPDYKAFFESYATTWRQVVTKEYEEYCLNVDAHSPNKFRVNAVLQQFEKFYETYGITQNDGMYVKPKDRVAIW
ncbi:M13 family metallopeptidase [Clostridium saccharobutylicum]|uniref:Neutral endopeptidase PepO n=1 Tax=Clostridium saccharobutylicum DSM 13864 TaxID=1345695 RepID=U5MXQ9_CLOSA|nr:M13 family metallopeptidase [Clostridium saccharobutylicum]AGX45343.1 neutral endopeptidase PepO [Clostridium saccharobutylicum DSM 13864]AQR92618.1 neutral endopeptidase [Clostridium saccharobutylicum]AQS02520.1 neutral endopeptidase [Clostridium saccharobutylicum]AQS12125.1 neutral endopeptidase [Clostridium saccharobutylicum]AQS16503.1 neutral endopeptidase [Clostridium saccharobutylicum]